MPSIFTERPRLAAFLVLTAAVFAAYSNVFSNPFLYDDLALIKNNLWLRSSDHLLDLLLTSPGGTVVTTADFYRPVTAFLWFCTYQIFGPEPFGFHLLNVSVHALNSFLVFRLGARLGFKDVACFFGALLWALHPANVETVTYMSDTSDLVAASFLLGCILLSLGGDQRWRAILVSAFFVAALLTKESSLVFPALLVACLLYLKPGREGVVRSFATWPFWVIGVAFIAARFALVQDTSLSTSDLPWEGLQSYNQKISVRTFTFLAVVPDYLGIVFWPHHLRFDRGAFLRDGIESWAVAFGLTAVIGIVCAGVAAWRLDRFRPMGWAILWFAVGFSINTGILVPIDSVIMEHWLYLPMIGLFLAGTQLLFLEAQGFKSPAKVAAGVFCFCLAAVIGVLSFQQNRVWSDGITFYSNIIASGELSPRAHNNLGLLYLEKKDFDRAIAEFRQSTVALPNFADGHADLALALMLGPDGNDHIPEAMAELQRAIAINPRQLHAYHMLAMIYRFRGDTANEQAMLAREAAIRAAVRPEGRHF